MNVLLLSLMYPKETLRDVSSFTKDAIQYQINTYQRALVEGVESCLAAGETLSIVNSLPVGTYPTKYRKLMLKGGLRDGRMEELGCVNLPWLKQKGRERKAMQAILAWAGESEQNRTVLIYTLYRPYLRAVSRAKKRIPNLKAAVIVTDLPNAWGLPSGRRGALQKIEYAMGRSSLRLCQDMDGYVLLTAPMSEILPTQGKQITVVEGLIQQEDPSENETIEAQPARPVVLYSGTLARDLGVLELIQAFQGTPEIELWLCGKGELAEEARRMAAENENIRFWGFVPREKALELQAKATLLINPRSPAGTFTRYSFPSKTIEYMRSGKPVLCYRLEGIPREYDEYLYYIQGKGPEGIQRSIRDLLGKSPMELRQRGEACRRFVREQKNPAAQCKKVVALLRSLHPASQDKA